MGFENLCFFGFFVWVLRTFASLAFSYGFFVWFLRTFALYVFLLPYHTIPYHTIPYPVTDSPTHRHNHCRKPIAKSTAYIETRNGWDIYNWPGYRKSGRISINHVVGHFDQGFTKWFAMWWMQVPWCPGRVFLETTGM